MSDRDQLIYWAEDLGRIVKSHQAKLPRFDQILEMLDIRPGMIILDIGAGTGQQSYRMAERLRGTGRVFATDMNPVFVDYMTAQARQRGLANMEAVLVRGNVVNGSGIDEFYARHKYDLVLLYDVFSYLLDRPAFYRHFTGLLTPRGRMVVCNDSAILVPVSREDFQDWEGFVEALEREPETNPFGWLLGRPLRAALRGMPRRDERLAERLVLLYLNRILDLPFFIHFLDGDRLRAGLDFNSNERVYADWMCSRIGLAGLPGERAFLSMPLREFTGVQRINKLLVIQRYRRYLIQQGCCPYESLVTENGWYRDEDALRWEFEAAGFEKKCDFPPFQAMWVLTASRASAARSARPHPFALPPVAQPRPRDGSEGHGAA